MQQHPTERLQAMETHSKHLQEQQKELSLEKEVLLQDLNNVKERREATAQELAKAQ